MSEAKTQVDSNIAVDTGQSKLSDLWLKEDYSAIWLGFSLLIANLIIFMPRAPINMHEVFDKSLTSGDAPTPRLLLPSPMQTRNRTTLLRASSVS